MRYAAQEQKTLWQGQSLVSGVNCQVKSAYDDFLSTKLLHHKESGWLYYHLVQSFPKDALVDPVAAHQAAVRLAGFFQDREVLVCTHVDRGQKHYRRARVRHPQPKRPYLTGTVRGCCTPEGKIE